MNILFILTDQFRFDCMGCMGHPDIKTPNLDYLAENGVLFNKAYCATMACGPARASIFTGRYSDTHKMFSNSKPLSPPDFKVLPEYLTEAGYDTALIGKLHLKPIERHYGFRYILRNDAPYTNYDPDEAADSAYIKYLGETIYKEDPEEPVRLFTEDEDCWLKDERRFMLGSNFIDEEHHMTTWTADETAKYIKEHRQEPFFLNCSFYGPHQPFLCPGRWEEMYDPETIPLPAGFENSFENKPIFESSFHHRLHQDRKTWSESDYRKMISANWGNISMIDHYIGKIFDTLKEENLWDNTIIIFSADHGEYGGQFKSFYKSLPYEGSIHIPMIIRIPGAVNNGGVDNRVVNNIDIFSTVLASAGVALPEDTESRDLSPLMTGSDAAWRNSTFFKIRNQAAIIKDNWKLMKEIVDEKVIYEFYDLHSDPYENNNLIDKNNFHSIVKDLKQELENWIAIQDR